MGLPPDILMMRLKNEIALCERHLPHDVSVLNDEIPLEIDIQLRGIEGACIEDGRVSSRSEHSVRIVIGEEYPFEKPRVSWMTPIFHPNIMMPEDGGHVCIKLLDGWGFDSTLLSFIKGVEYLVSNPNPLSPFGTESCTMAAEYYNRSGRTLRPMATRPAPRIVR